MAALLLGSLKCSAWAMGRALVSLSNINEAVYKINKRSEIKGLGAWSLEPGAGPYSGREGDSVTCYGLKSHNLIHFCCLICGSIATHSSNTSYLFWQYHVGQSVEVRYEIKYQNTSMFSAFSFVFCVNV